MENLSEITPTKTSDNDVEETSRPQIPLGRLTQAGYDHTFVHPVHPEDYCGVCLLVVRDPVQVSQCGHAFCKTCLDYWFSICKEKQDPSLTCPSDNEVITEEDVIVDRKSRRSIRNLQVYCDNRCHGCVVITELKELETHMAVCEHKMVTCPLNCGHVVAAWSLDVHTQDECLKRLLPCSLCKTEIEVGQLKINAHYAECPEYSIECNYKAFGCNMKLLQKEAENHERDFMQCHMDLLKSSFFRQQLETDQIREKLTSENQTLKNDLKTTRDELQLCREEFMKKQWENCGKAMWLQCNEKYEQNNATLSSVCEKIDRKLENIFVHVTETEIKLITPFICRLEMRRGMEEKISPVFYSNKGDYRMSIKAGHGNSDDYYYFKMCAERDSKFPCTRQEVRGEFTLTVTNANTEKALCSSVYRSYPPNVCYQTLTKENPALELISCIFRPECNPQIVDISLNPLVSKST